MESYIKSNERKEERKRRQEGKKEGKQESKRRKRKEGKEEEKEGGTERNGQRRGKEYRTRAKAKQGVTGGEDCRKLALWEDTPSTMLNATLRGPLSLHPT